MFSCIVLANSVESRSAPCTRRAASSGPIFTIPQTSWEAYANDTLRSREDVDTDAAVQCPDRLPEHGLNARVVATTSSCPWINSETFDADRIPMVIQHARCLCDGCFDPRDGILQRDLTCSPIEINMDVLRKTETRNGYVRWSPTTERVSVGCACQIELMA